MPKQVLPATLVSFNGRRARSKESLANVLCVSRGSRRTPSHSLIVDWGMKNLSSGILLRSSTLIKGEIENELRRCLGLRIDVGLVPPRTLPRYELKAKRFTRV